MRKGLVVLSGTANGLRRDWATSATDALRMVLDHMKFRRVGVKVQDERGNPVTFVQLEEMAESESREKNSRA